MTEPGESSELDQLREEYGFTIPRDDYGLPELRADHPLWTVTTRNDDRPTGPGGIHLTATREGVTLTAWSAELMSRYMAETEAARGWPCRLGGPPIRQI